MPLSTFRRAVRSHLGSKQVARVVYGAIIGLALVVALEEHPPSPGAVAATILATALAVALAEVYSDFVGTEVRTRRLGRAHVGDLSRDAAAVAFGISFPAVLFVLAALGAMETATAFTAAKWSGLGLIGLYGFCAARLAGVGLPRSILHAVAVGTVGGMLIAVKAVLH